MKNFNSYVMKGMLYVSLITVSILTGCGPKDEDPVAPTINVSPEATQNKWKGDTASYTVTMGGNEELSSYVISPDIRGKNADDAPTGSLTGNNSTINYMYVVDSALVSEGINVTITFTVTDKKGLTGSTTRTIKITETKTQLVEKTNPGFVYNVDGPNKGAWDLVGDSAISLSGNEAVKDIKDTSGVDFEPSWIAGTGNGSMFVKSTTYDWDNATDVSARDAYSAGLQKTSTGVLAVGDYVVVKLRGGNDYAVVKVTEVTVTSSTDNLDYVKFVYKKKP